MSQDQFGALTCVNPCTWLVRSIKLVPRPLHDEAKTISKNWYSKDAKLYFNTLKGKVWHNLKEDNWVGPKWKPDLFPCGYVKACSLLKPIQYFVWIICRFWRPWPLKLSRPNFVHTGARIGLHLIQNFNIEPTCIMCRFLEDMIFEEISIEFF